jgi:hypothetical protein
VQITFTKMPCRIFFLILIYFCLYEQSTAQKMYLADKEDINLRYDDFSVVGKMNQKIVTYRRRNNLPELIIYNAQMIKEMAIPASFIPENHIQLYFTCDGQSVLVFYQLRENKQDQLFVASLDPNTYKWDTPMMIHSHSTIGRERITYQKISSEKRNYHLLYISYRDEGYQVVKAVVVAHHTLQYTTFEYKLSAKELTISDLGAISNQGHAMLLAHDYPSNRGTFDMVQCIYLTKDAQIKEEKVDIEKHIVSEIKLKVDESTNTLYIAGIFAEGRYNQPKGLFFIQTGIEPGKEKSSHFLPMAIQGTNQDNSIREIKIRHLYVKKDGGIELVAEKYSQNIRNIQSVSPMVTMGMFSTLPDNSRQVQEFYYDEIFVFNIRRDGSLDWSQIILKEQMSNDDNGIFSSFGVMQHRLGRAYIFNELQTKSDRLMAGFLSYKGEFTMKELQTNESIDDWSLMPRSALQISASEIIMPCLSKNHLSFLKIAF